MNKAIPGMRVQWTRWDGEGQGSKKNKGIIFADVPAGANIYDVCRMNGITPKRNRFGSAVSKNHRAIVLVWTGENKDLETFYAPRISTLEQIET